MAIKVRMSGQIMNLPISALTGKSAQILQELGPDTEALVTKNTETLGVFMSVARRNALAEAEDKLHAALLHIDMLTAGRTHADIERSAEAVRQRRGTSLDAFLDELRAE